MTAPAATHRAVVRASDGLAALTATAAAAVRATDLATATAALNAGPY